MEVYENSPVSSDDEAAVPVLIANEEIITDSVSKEEVVRSLLALEQETTEQKIARIQQEIQDLARSGAVKPALNLVDQLSSISHVSSAIASPNPVANNEKSVSSAEFLKLEERVCQLELFCGLDKSRNPSNFVESLQSAQKTLKYLSQDVQRVQSIDSPLNSKIDYIYSRIASLDDAIKILPYIVKRMETLRNVHVQQLELVESETETMNTLAQMEQSVEEWRICLDAMEKKVEKLVQNKAAD